jgi:NADH-quinone oxidoreductase subunit F
MKRGAVEVRIGLGSCGIASGAEAVRDVLQQAVEVKTVGCNGMCYREPLVQVVERSGRVTLYSNVTVQTARLIVRRHFKPAANATSTKQERIVLENCGEIDPLNIDDYLARDGYRALALCRAQPPDQVIAAIAASGLRGRGGAGFPTARKWALGRAQADPIKYVVCNGDEGDPGAFMDRAVLESDPHRVLEGLAIAAHAIGAAEGYLYIRAEYPLAVRHVRAAILLARARGYLGALHLEVREGAGAFVCGEETALIQSLEGRR